MDDLKTKLTLSCNKEIIEEAKKYASLEDDTLSGLVEEYLLTYITVKKNKAEGNEPLFNADIAKLSGSFKLGKKRNYKKQFHSYGIA
jgi:hypothetical protein